MRQQKEIEIVEVDGDNVSKTGFFCYMSKKKSEGYQRKLKWLKARFAEGMKIKIIEQGGRGFIEYIPGEYAWRAVNAEGYLFIHCLWVVGKSKGKGCGSLLLNDCVKEAKRLRMKGLAMVTTEAGDSSGRGLGELSPMTNFPAGTFTSSRVMPSPRSSVICDFSVSPWCFAAAALSRGQSAHFTIG